MYMQNTSIWTVSLTSKWEGTVESDMWEIKCQLSPPSLKPAGMAASSSNAYGQIREMLA